MSLCFQGVVGCNILWFTCFVSICLTERALWQIDRLPNAFFVSTGLMLVGPTGSGKTKSYESLKIAMTYMKGKINPAGTPFKPVHTYVLNPKSITMGQLYGAFDDLTHEW